MLTEK